MLERRRGYLTHQLERLANRLYDGLDRDRRVVRENKFAIAEELSKGDPSVRNWRMDPVRQVAVYNVNFGIDELGNIRFDDPNFGKPGALAIGTGKRINSYESPAEISKLAARVIARTAMEYNGDDPFPETRERIQLN